MCPIETTLTWLVVSLLREGRYRTFEIRDWLSQFEDTRLRSVALTLLRRIKDHGYFSSQRVAEDLGPRVLQGFKESAVRRRVLHNMNGTYTRNVVIGVLSEYDRPAAEQIASALSIPKRQVLSVEKAITWLSQETEQSVLLLFETFDGVGDRLVAASHQVAADLVATRPGARAEVAIGLMTCVTARAGDEQVGPTGWLTARIVGIRAPSDWSAFGESSTVVSTGNREEIVTSLLPLPDRSKHGIR